MTYTMKEAIKIARQRRLTIPRNIALYMDDCWATILDPPRRLGLRNSDDQTRDPVSDFLDCLNSVHSRVQFTKEDEEDISIPFLDVHITRHEDGHLSTRVYRKPSNTNIGLKPQSCQAPKTAVAAFKGELCRCHRLCSDPSQVKKEIDFVLNLFEDNGHNRAKLKQIADTYVPPHHKQNNSNNTRSTTKANRIQADNDTKALFDELPFRNFDLTSDEEWKTYACLTYIPEVAPQLKRALSKAGVNTTFTSAPKLKDILCGRNKSNPPKDKRKGIYRYTCTCSKKAIYIGQTHRSCEIRWKEHERAIQNEQWHHSGITQHHQHCQHTSNKDNFEVIHTTQDKKKGRLAFNLKVREAFEIRRHGSGPGKGLNEDNGAYLKMDIWDPVLNNLNRD